MKFLEIYSETTHNLEVLGSSPRWPTFKKERKHSRAIASAFFFSLSPLNLESHLAPPLQVLAYALVERVEGGLGVDDAS